jgi:hypothetical protein
MHDDTERWQRLTILDILCLFPSFALGAATVRYLIDHPSPTPYAPRPWPTDASLFSLVFVALVLGSVFAGPLSLAVQFLFRHRRTRLSLGEWLWLEPIPLCIVASYIGRPTPIWFILFLIVQTLLSILSLAMLAMFGLCAWESDQEVEYRWTDVLGNLSCGSFGIMVLYFLILNSITI